MITVGYSADVTASKYICSHDHLPVAELVAQEVQLCPAKDCFAMQMA